MKLTRIPHLEGDPGVAITIREMRRLVRQGKQDPVIHELAAKILRTARVPAYEWEAEARAVFDSVHRNLRFTRDVHGNEALHGAADIVRLGIGDCDDFTVLICSLMQTIGAPCRIITISVDPDGEFSHVYPEVEINGRWIAMDAARRAPAFGKSPERYTRKRAWDLDSEGYTDMGRFRLGALGIGRTFINPGEGPQGAWSPKVYPPFRVAARRMTGTYLNAFPVAPPHQRFHRPPVGFGNYGVPAARRALGCAHKENLGAWGDCAAGDTGCEVANIIQAGTQGASNVIAASRANPYNLVPNLVPGGGAAAPLRYTNPPAYGGSTFSGIDPTTLLIGGGLLLAVVLEGRR
jgi:hypothetical protein